MMTSHAKSRTAQRDGYFHDFTRVMAVRIPHLRDTTKFLLFSKLSAL